MRNNSLHPSWKFGTPIIAACLLVSLLCACIIPGSQTQTPANSTSNPGETPTSITYGGSDELNPDQVATLSSLKKIDDHPLYTMQYAGQYSQIMSGLLDEEKFNQIWSSNFQQWSCSLFAALGDDQDMSFGRNFDWQFSPALLLFTKPPDGYASVSMVDMAYLGFDPDQAGALTELSLEDRQALLLAPHLPFDGMNETGLTIGMAAVPPGNMITDPARTTIDSLDVIRQILDKAANIEQAIAILGSYNIDYGSGPPLHYLIADASGNAVLVEFYQGQMHLIRNEKPWLSATNFLLSSVDDPQGQCWRYDKIDKEMKTSKGNLSKTRAMELLSSVSQTNTQWSIIYHMTTAKIEVVMGRQYDHQHEFILKH